MEFIVVVFLIFVGALPDLLCRYSGSITMAEPWTPQGDSMGLTNGWGGRKEKNPNECQDADLATPESKKRSFAFLTCLQRQEGPGLNPTWDLSVWSFRVLLVLLTL